MSDTLLAAVLRRFLAENTQYGGYVAFNGPPSDAVLILDGKVNLLNEDEYRAVQEACNV